MEGHNLSGTCEISVATSCQHTAICTRQATSGGKQKSRTPPTWAVSTRHLMPARFVFACSSRATSVLWGWSPASQVSKSNLVGTGPRSTHPMVEVSDNRIPPVIVRYANYFISSVLHSFPKLTIVVMWNWRLGKHSGRVIMKTCWLIESVSTNAWCPNVLLQMIRIYIRAYKTIRRPSDRGESMWTYWLTTESGQVRGRTSRPPAKRTHSL